MRKLISLIAVVSMFCLIGCKNETKVEPVKVETKAVETSSETKVEPVKVETKAVETSSETKVEPVKVETK